MEDNQALIDRVRTRLVDQKILKPDDKAIATQGFLRLGANINMTLNSISFNVLANQGTIINTERRLSLTDMFTVTHWALYLVKAGGVVSGGGLAATADDLAIATNYTYPNPFVFSTAAQGLPTFLTNNGATALLPYTRESLNLSSIYNGNISVSIERQVIIDAYDTMRFLRRPATMMQVNQGAATAAGAAVIGGSAGAVGDSWEGDSVGFSRVDPQFTMSGAGDNNITIQLPSSLSLAGALSTNFVFLQMRGIRWQNASKLNG